MDNIWDGDGENQNAALTIFRHFDSTTVTKGLIGDKPLTGWVIDYPFFERLHNLLVAGFNGLWHGRSPVSKPDLYGYLASGWGR
ncbi:MAG: fatty acid cis/trans isomerase [Gammaproteobacteria bacterium]